MRAMRALLFGCLLLLVTLAPPARAADRLKLAADAQLPVPVRVALRVLNITEINQIAGRARLLIEITQRWTDSRNRFDSIALGAPRVDRIGSEAEDFLKTIWAPGLAVDNQIGSAQARMLAVSAFADGAITLVDRYEADFRITPDMSGFPFDRQPLSLTFSLPRYASADVVLLTSELDRQFSVVESKITVVNWRPSGLIFSNDETTGWNARHYSRLEATFTLERLSSRFILRILVPIGAALMISIFVLWMPGVSPKDKGGLVVSALLALTAMSFTFENSFPGSISLNTPVAKIISMAYLYLVIVLLVDGLISGPSGDPTSRFHALAFETKRQVKWAFPAIMLVLCIATLTQAIPR